MFVVEKGLDSNKILHEANTETHLYQNTITFMTNMKLLLPTPNAATRIGRILFADYILFKRHNISVCVINGLLSLDVFVCL